MYVRFYMYMSVALPFAGVGLPVQALWWDHPHRPIHSFFRVSAGNIEKLRMVVEMRLKIVEWLPLGLGLVVEGKPWYYNTELSRPFAVLRRSLAMIPRSSVLMVSPWPTLSTQPTWYWWNIDQKWNAVSTCTCTIHVYVWCCISLISRP